MPITGEIRVILTWAGLPGWEVDVIRGEMFSDGYGFVVDYLAEILRSLRNHDYSDRYQHLFLKCTSQSFSFLWHHHISFLQ